MPGFSISRLANAEDYFNANIFFICKYVRINDYSFKYVCIVSMLLKNLFLLPRLFWNVEFEFSWFHSTKESSEILILEIDMLLEFQNKTNIEMMGCT